MKFCGNCGKQIDDNAIFCPYCGTRTNGETNNQNNPYASMYGGYRTPYPVYDTTPSKLITVISFLSWQVGFILWLIFKRNRPGKAESAFKGAIARACVSMPVLGLVLWIIWKKEYGKQELGKIAGVCALVGVGIYVMWFILQVVAALSGISMETVIPGMDAMAYVTTLLK